VHQNGINLFNTFLMSVCRNKTVILCCSESSSIAYKTKTFPADPTGSIFLFLDLYSNALSWETSALDQPSEKLYYHQNIADLNGLFMKIKSVIPDEKPVIFAFDSLSPILQRNAPREALVFLTRLQSLRGDYQIVGIVHHDLHDENTHAIILKFASVNIFLRNKPNAVDTTVLSNPFSDTFFCESLIKRKSGKVIREKLAIKLEKGKATFNQIQDKKEEFQSPQPSLTTTTMTLSKNLG